MSETMTVREGADDECPGSGRTLTLYEVDEGGATTWVLALNEDDAVRVLIENYCTREMTAEEIDHDFGWEGGRPPAVDAVPRHRAEALGVDDDAGESVSLADCCKDEPRRGIVASTEC